MRSLRRSSITLILALSLLAGSAGAGIRVVSDLDDTTKITNVGDPLAALVNGLFGNRAFAGMREMYTSFAIERKYTFDYVSGASEALRFRAARFLENGGFPVGALHLRPLLGSGTVREYKTRVIRQLMDRNPTDAFIFVGDDTTVDFEVYDDLFRYAPDRILAIYIRKVTNHKLPPSTYPFLTAFDLARTEFSMGRLTAAEASPVALAILGERRDRRIIPGFSYCPSSVGFVGDPQIEAWNRAINTRVQSICRKRQRSTLADSVD